jgi:O-antigen/teichoic acid export membrane protein
VVLIPRFGGYGAAVATAAAVLVESSLLFWVTKRRLGLHVFIWRPRIAEIGEYRIPNSE